LTKFQLIVFNLLMVFCAILTTAGLVRSGETGEQLPAYEGLGSEEQQGARPLDGGPALVATMPSPDDLYAKNLFVPERGPRTIEPGEEPEEPEEVQDLELTGIGRIGDQEAAIIVVGRPRRVVRGRGGRRPPPAATGGKKRIYEVGDEIDDTGYRLEKIIYSREEGTCEVLLSDSRGGERVLRMETDDTASVARAEKAVVAAREQQATVNVREPARDASSPPPPPPAPGGEGGEPPTPPTPTLTTGDLGDDEKPSKPVSEMTRQERLKWAIEMRRRHMQNRNDQSENN
jgi:hypothetical protein